MTWSLGDQLRQNKIAFYDVANFPNVIGLIDYSCAYHATNVLPNINLSIESAITLLFKLSVGLLVTCTWKSDGQEERMTRFH